MTVEPWRIRVLDGALQELDTVIISCENREVCEFAWVAKAWIAAAMATAVNSTDAKEYVQLAIDLAANQRTDSERDVKLAPRLWLYLRQLHRRG